MNRCDGIRDCDDSFDETECHLVIIQNNLYRKENPPLREDRKELFVSLNVSILAISNLHEIEMTFALKFLIQIKWYFL